MSYIFVPLDCLDDDARPTDDYYDRLGPALSYESW